MEQKCCEVQCSETDEGFRIELKGTGIQECIKSLKKGTFSCCNTGKGQ
ncbi:MAG: hypothetical protein K0A89_08745 [ANME-2 cluster archaeon]|nr:hypothetical protein [ANME-2 cluster archaeon]